MLLIFGAGKAETGAIFQYRSFSQQFPRENFKLIIWIEWLMSVMRVEAKFSVQKLAYMCVVAKNFRFNRFNTS